jgi:DNA-binding transcriptional MerR regulator
MNKTFSVGELANQVNEWCERNDVVPANGQAGESITVRNIRYYRTLGLLDPPAVGGGNGFGEKHRLQLVAIRLLQAQGLPLGRIQQLLYGRSLDDLKRIETEGLTELAEAQSMMPTSLGGTEFWSVTPLNREFMIVSRNGRGLSQEVRKRLTAVLEDGQGSAQIQRQKGSRYEH